MTYVNCVFSSTVNSIVLQRTFFRCSTEKILQNYVITAVMFFPDNRCNLQHVVSYHVMSYRVVSNSDVILCCVIITYHVTSWCVTIIFVMLSHNIPNYVTSCYITLCHIISYHATCVVQYFII
jgi:hypothetical protein